MITPKRKSHQQHSEKSYSKKLKTNEILKRKGLSPIHLKSISANWNNVNSAEKSGNKVNGGKSVACFFKKIKNLSDISTDEKIKSNDVDCNNRIFEEIEKQGSKLISHEHFSSKCNSLRSMNKGSNLNHFTLIEKKQTCPDNTYFKNEISHNKFSSEDRTKINYRSLRESDKFKNNISSHKIRKNYIDQCQGPQISSYLGKKRRQLPQLLFTNNTLKNTSFLQSTEKPLYEGRCEQILKPPPKKNISPFESKDSNINYAELSPKNIYTGKIDHSPFNQDESNSIKLKSVPENTFSLNNEQFSIISDNSKKCSLEKNQLMKRNRSEEENQDFHSMHSTLSHNIRESPLPSIFSMENIMLSSSQFNKQQKLSRKNIFTCFKEQSEASLNHSISQNKITKVSSFEIFVENFPPYENEDALSNNFPNLFRQSSHCGNKEKNNTFNTNINLHTKSDLLVESFESKNQKMLKMKTKMNINKDELNLQRGKIQSKTRSKKNTFESLKLKNTNGLINNYKPITQSLCCSSIEDSNNKVKISSGKYLDSCEGINSIVETDNLISDINVNTKTLLKDIVIKMKSNSVTCETQKCMFFTYSSQENNDKSSNYLKSNCFNHIGTEWRDNSNHIIEFEEKNSNSKKGNLGKKKWSQYPIIPFQIEPHQTQCIKAHANMFQNSINSGISERIISDCNNEHKENNKKCMITNCTTLKNLESSERECNNFFENRLKICINSEGDIIHPVLDNQNKENIYNENPISCYKDQTLDISQRNITETLSNRLNRKLPKVQKSTEHSVKDCEQLGLNLNSTSDFKLDGSTRQDMNITCNQLNNNKRSYVSSLTLKAPAYNRIRHTFPYIPHVSDPDEWKHFDKSKALEGEDHGKILKNAINKKLDFKSTSDYSVQDISYKELSQIEDDSNYTSIIRKVEKRKKVHIKDHLESTHALTKCQNAIEKSSENLNKFVLSENSKNKITDLESFIPQSSDITDVFPGGKVFCKKLRGNTPILYHNSEEGAHICDEKINKEKEIISAACAKSPKLNDQKASVDATTENTSFNHSFSKHEYLLLKKSASPLLADLECRNYLKSLINQGLTDKTSSSDFHSRKDNLQVSIIRTQDSCPDIIENEVLPFNTLPDSENIKQTDISKYSYVDSQEKELFLFWNNIFLQNQHLNSKNENYSQNVAHVVNCDESFSEERTTFTQNSNDIIGKTSQESGSEAVNYILSQNFTESDLELRGILKNMSILSQKSIKNRNSLHDFNQNSNILLEMALKMYKQCSTRIILSNIHNVSFSKQTRNRVEVEQEEDVKIYKMKEGSNDDFGELMIVRINHDSNCFGSENYIFSNTKNGAADEKILKGLNRIYQDKTFFYKKQDDSFDYLAHDTASIITKIENTFEQVLKDLASNKSPQLRVRRQTFQDCSIHRKRLMLKPDGNPRMIKIHYKNVSSQPKFCLMMYVLAKSLKLLKNNSKITKREIYYQIKTFVSNQGKVDSAIKAVSCMLSVGPWNLNIIAHKGIVFGDLKITLSSNEIINCNIPGTLIPHDVDDFVQIKSSAYFILVVEKESIYYKLLEEDLPNRLVKPFIMITGKGFPDLNTQLFLRKLWMVMSLPVFILTDADPHGVNIMITYKFGSLANAHISHQLSVPKAKWLGVFPSEITKYDAEKESLTENEKRVIENLLKTPYMTGNPKIEAELKILLESGHKAAIEGIIKNDTFLSEFYFPLKFYNQDLI